ncbi:MAG TPA: DUF2442 domain-containing protein [Mesorhizobium sp.]|jgi:hypothetical protein|nr:DUF2442 domain-containing protein [Mesorhizobium sp.]
MTDTRLAFEFVNVLTLRPVEAFRLHVQFSDGSEGVHDFSAMLAEPGPMLEPLRDPSYFARVFVDDGAPAWPNGFDVDPTCLHQEMLAAGELRRSDAA